MMTIHKAARGRPIYVVLDTLNDANYNILEVDFGNAR
jgi:hypothetical protein